MRSKTLFASLLTATLLAAPAFAQPPAPRAPAAAKAKQPDPARREARRVQALERAGVDAVRARRVAKILAGFDSQRSAARAEMKTHRQALRQLIASKSTDETAYRRALDGMRAAKAKLDSVQDRQVEAVAKVLKPSEQAKLLAQLRGHRGGKAGKAGKPGKPGKPARRR